MKPCDYSNYGLAQEILRLKTHAPEIMSEAARRLQALAAQPRTPAELGDEEIIAINEGERFFSVSESRFGRDCNPHDQYHSGKPGVLQFARELLRVYVAAAQPQPRTQAEPALQRSPFTAEQLADIVPEGATFSPGQFVKMTYPQLHQFATNVLAAQPRTPAEPVKSRLTRDEVDALVYRCRQDGNDSTYALADAIAAHLHGTGAL